ncbi:MAG: DUF302 domain-containing protein [Mariprofundaceae bacterium]|nr:DUF302 domain-containing protein [Mariprofundaceae bacterium]
MGINALFILLALIFVLLLTLVLRGSGRSRKEDQVVSDQARHHHFKRSVEEVQRQQKEEQAAIILSEDSSVGGVIYTKRGFGKKVKIGVDEAVEQVREAFKAGGFQILSDADIMTILHKKEMLKYHMLIAYHEELGGMAIDMEPSIGLLTCNAVIRQDMSGVVHVEFTDPFLQMGSTNHAELQSIAANLKRKLLRVLQAF